MNGDNVIYEQEGGLRLHILKTKGFNFTPATAKDNLYRNDWYAITPTIGSYVDNASGDVKGRTDTRLKIILGQVTWDTISKQLSKLIDLRHVNVF